MRSDAGTRLAVLLVLLSSCASADDLRHAYTGRHAGFGQDIGVSDSGPGDLTQDEGKADPGPADPGADDGWIDHGPTDQGVADEGIDADADACVPDCTGKSCGATDGCGGKCTGCVANATCNTETWSCDCTGPWCESGSMCCGKGQTCEAGDTCTGTCQPQCAGKECGPNGCPGGGTCGTCDGGKQCESGKCVCKLQDHKGCVGGNVNWYDSCGVEGTVAETCG